MNIPGFDRKKAKSRLAELPVDALRAGTQQPRKTFDGEELDSHRFDEVERLEAMTPDERFAFWQGELSRCIRCNACRDICPAKAIVLEDGKPQIDRSRCITCFCGQELCPKGALEAKRTALARLLTRTE